MSARVAPQLTRTGATNISIADGRAGIANVNEGTVELLDLETGARTDLDLLGTDGSSLDVLVAHPDPGGAWLITRDHRLLRSEDGRIVDELPLGSVDGVVGIPVPPPVGRAVVRAGPEAGSRPPTAR